MLSNTLLALYRSLARHKLYAALNVFGLAFGIAVFLVLTLVVRYESRFDRWIPNAENTYRLDTIWTLPGRAPYEGADTSFVTLNLLRSDFPQILNGTRAMPRDVAISVGGIVDSEEITFVDANFLDVLNLPLLSGDERNALASPASIVMDAATARKYFGTTQALGRTLNITYRGDKRAFTVGAVMRDLPQNSSMNLHILVPFTPAVQATSLAFHKWGSSSGYVYLQFRNQQDAQNVSAGLRDFIARRAAGEGDDQEGTNPENHLALSLVALPDIHFHDIGVDSPKPGVDRRIVLSLGAVGLLALITAAINYINLATARSGLRAREVALRKVMGATRQMLLLQFLGEATALVALAAVIGLMLAALAVPIVNTLGGWDIHIDYIQVLPLLCLLVLVVGIGAGLYPALLLAAYRPAQVLAAARTPAGGRMGAQLRNLLVIAQFASAIGFAICTLVIDSQAAYLRDADRGFERSGLIIIQSLADEALLDRQNTILDALRRVPGVISATLSNREPDSNNTDTEGVTRPGLPGPKPNLIYETVGRDYFSTYGIPLIAGRLLDDAHRTDDLAGTDGAGRTSGVVINQTAVAVLGYGNPDGAIGKNFTTATTPPANHVIVGVVKDVRFMSPRDPVTAQFYAYDSKHIDYANAAVRFKGVPLPDMMAALQTAWRNVAPENPFVAKTADERLAEFYRPDSQRALLFSAGAALAIGIACVGLYGLASFNTARRMKEMGIRKTLGASTADVLLLLVGQFIRPVALANVIAWPVAWFVMRGWLASFDQRIDLSPVFFVEATLGALAISILTVLGQAIRVARAEPARALRYE